ncbi:MAG: hypothetical protein RLY71_882 [Pseudomonadota bacterium]
MGSDALNKPITYQKEAGVATLTFNRAEARNALTPEMLCRLADAIVDFANDDNLRVAIITGTGDKAFCSGGDLARTLPLLTGHRPPTDEWDRRLLGDPVVSAASSLRGYPLNKPVISAINGTCLAAGMELMLATDIRVAAIHASFGLPEVTRALIPFAGSMARLPRQIPYCQAMELMLVGDAINADEALRRGLVNYVVPADQVMEKAHLLARKIAANGPLAVQSVKQTVMATSGLELQQSFLIEDQAKRVVLSSEDAREGPRAFTERRLPRFIGR